MKAPPSWPFVNFFSKGLISKYHHVEVEVVVVGRGDTIQSAAFRNIKITKTLKNWFVILHLFFVCFSISHFDTIIEYGFIVYCFPHRHPWENGPVFPVWCLWRPYLSIMHLYFQNDLCPRNERSFWVYKFQVGQEKATGPGRRRKPQWWQFFWFLFPSLYVHLSILDSLFCPELTAALEHSANGRKRWNLDSQRT